MKVKLVLAMTLLLGITVLAQIQKPKLILQITVDQLRGDMPDKFMKNMGDGDFRYLKYNGIWYSNTHYGHVRKTEPKDIASTLANILGTKPPSGADGEVLFEVTNQLNK